MKIVVIMPTYNEKANMEKMIPLLMNEVFTKIKNHDMAILVADDKSPDGTADTVKDFKKKWNTIHLLEGEKKGLGAAYARAMRYAMDTMHADAVVEFDSDFQHDPNDIPRLIEAMDKGYDYVIGSRYVPGGEIPKEWGMDRKIKSIFGSLFARIVLLNSKVHDMTSGFKLTKSEYLRKVDLEHLYSDYYAYKIHILHDVIKSGAKVVEVPIKFYERVEGSSKLESKEIFESLRVVLMLRYRDSKRFIKFLIVGGTGFIVQLTAQEMSVLLGFAYFLAGLLLPYETQVFGTGDIEVLKSTIAVAIGAEAAIISNFLINNFWTFRDTRQMKEKSPAIIRLVKFNITSLISIFLQVGVATIAVRMIGTHIPILGLAIPTRILVLFPTIIIVVIPLNYLIYNKIIWKTQHLKHAHNKTS
jgi:dolichol-phosphate mannosyltransferase